MDRSCQNLEDCDLVFRKDRCSDFSVGLCALKEGKLGLLVLAGGQGTRLQFPGPKGLFPIFPHMCLFDVFERYRLDAYKAYGQKPAFALMCSEENYRETKAHLPDADLFCQKNLPLQTKDGQETDLYGPNGNGEVFELFYTSGVWESWWAKGVRSVAVMNVDNVLTDPFELEYIDFHIKSGAELSLRGGRKNGPQDKLGTLVKRDKSIEVIEYSELSDEMRYAQNADGSLKYGYCYLGMMHVEMGALERLGKKPPQLPWHTARKKYLLDGQWCELVKRERFIFDNFPYFLSSSVFVDERSLCFCPLKERTDIPRVQAALSHKFKLQ